MVSVRSTLAASFACLCILAGPIRASDDAGSLKRALTEQLKSTQTWQAQMEQTLAMPDLEPIHGTARISYEKPDRLKIDFTEPKGQWLLLYEVAGWYQKPGASRQAVDLPAQSGPIAMYQFLPKLLNGQLDVLSEGYRETSMLTGSGVLFLILEAEEAGTQPSRIVCRVDAASLALQEIRLVFSTHQASLQMSFQEAQRDVALPANIFKIPADAPEIGSKER